MPVVETDLTLLRESIGTSFGPTEWVTVNQERINLFAEATGDHQWIHVDSERASDGPYRSTIAHGYLSLSLIPVLTQGLLPIGGFAGGLNYGSNKVRYPHILPVDTRVRATTKLLSVEAHPLGAAVTQEVAVEAEGFPKPVCIAETVTLLFR